MDADGNDNTPEWGTCQQEGCANAADPYWLPDSEPPDDPDGLYCAEHVHAAGWCWGCGNFWAGVERFDFSRTGLCENCEPGYLHEIGEGDERDWENDFCDDEDFYDTATQRG